MQTRSIVWAFGGGVQSAAMAVLIAQGNLPTPAASCIADTGREAETTWRYMDDVIVPLLSTCGVTITRIPHELATVDLRSTKGKLLIPAYDLTSGAPMPTYCSVEWKRRVMRRWLRQQGYGPRRPIITWLGISLDEWERCRSSDVKWERYEYPLVRLYLRREDCVRIVADAGLPPAPRSSCWMCPFRRTDEWAALTSGDAAKAAALDAQLRETDNVTIYSRTATAGCASGICFT